MKQFRITITEIAEIDIETGKNWYNSQQNKLGDEFISEMENKIPGHSIKSLSFFNN